MYVYYLGMQLNKYTHTQVKLTLICSILHNDKWHTLVINFEVQQQHDAKFGHGVSKL